MMKIFRRNKIACNSGSDNRIATAVNNRAFTKDGEWQQIAPYGVFPHRLGRQKFNRERAKIIAANIAAEAVKHGKEWRGIPIFIGHPRERGGDEDQLPEPPRIGAVMEAEDRDDGLWGRIADNAKGKENRAEGYHVYPSPGWLFDEGEAGEILPRELDHIGMTNTPNLAGSKPWTNSTSNNGTQHTENKTESDMKKIIELLKLAEGATEEQIVAAITKVLSDLDTAQAKQTEALNKADEAVKKEEEASTLATNSKTAYSGLESRFNVACNALLVAAIKDGRITEAEKANHEQALKANTEVAVNALASLQPKHDTKGVHLEYRGARFDIATNAADRQRVISTAVNSRMKEYGEPYETAYDNVSRDPQFKAVFENMVEPKKG